MRLRAGVHVKTRKHWASQTIRQAAAVSRLFFVEMLGVKGWKVFGQIRTKDSGKLPGVLTRLEVIRLLCHIRLRRYRTPVKLIYCAGLRLSEPSRPGQAARWTVDAGDSPKGEAAAGRLSNQCLSLTIHDIKPDHLIVRDGSRTLRGRGETDSPEASP